MPENIEEIQKLLAALKENSGYDFSGYSINSFRKRIIKILNAYSIEYEELVKRVKSDTNFKEEVVKRITVNTTDFFRDTDLWIYLREKVIPDFSHKKRISIWLPGCSTGQEVYSLAILLNEMMLLDKTDIIASDINEDALNIARKGEYRSLFSKEYMSNFHKVFNTSKSHESIDHEKYFIFDLTDDRIIMNPVLTRKPVFIKMDLVRDPGPIEKKFDIIFCRNVIIYFNRTLQNHVLNLLFQNMNDKSCLILGKHERVKGEYESRLIRQGPVYFKKSEI